MLVNKKGISKKLIPLVATVLLAVIGVNTLIGSHAATPSVVSDAANGTLSSGATTVTDPTAASGSAVKFGSKGPIYGVLLADPTYIQTDTAAGIRLATLDVGWNDWEPTNGDFSQSYINQVATEVSTYEAAGWEVAISIGLQYPPSWVLALPNGQLMDQNGDESGTPNYEFNQTVRSYASAYIDNIVSTLSSYNISYYRVGLADTGEMTFGPVANNNNWWAFDALAQGQSSGLPSGVPVSPLPGWIPGTTTYAGTTITQAQVQDWYNWYLGALTNAETWEINTYRSAGYTGTLQLVMPGDGATPELYSERIADDLASESFDGYYTMNTGTAYQLVLNAIPLQNTVIDVSSVQDDGISVSASNCQTGDASLSLSDADPWTSGWSSVRWLTYLADQHGLAVMGENPGSNSAAQMAETFALVQSCHLIALQWAFDYQLYDGTDATVSDYAADISAAH